MSSFGLTPSGQHPNGLCEQDGVITTGVLSLSYPESFSGREGGGWITICPIKEIIKSKIKTNTTI